MVWSNYLAGRQEWLSFSHRWFLPRALLDPCGLAE